MKRTHVIVAFMTALAALSASALIIQANPTLLPGGVTPPQCPEDYLLIRDAIMKYIWDHHEDARDLMGYPCWSYLGNGTFKGGGWAVIVKGGLSSASVTVDYSMPYHVGIPHRIIWEGSFTNGAVEEASYIHAQ